MRSAGKGEAEARLDGVEHGERCRHDLDADALAGHDGNAERVRFHRHALPYRGRAIKAKRLARPPATTMTSTLTALTAGVAPSRIWPYM